MTFLARSTRRFHRFFHRFFHRLCMMHRMVCGTPTKECRRFPRRRFPSQSSWMARCLAGSCRCRLCATTTPPTLRWRTTVCGWTRHSRRVHVSAARSAAAGAYTVRVSCG
eukprot:3002279-Rhodomonas_salina.1